MAFEIRKVTDKRIVYSSFYGIVTAEDVRDEIQEAQALADKSDLPLRIIVNFSDVDKMVLSLWDMRQIAASTPDCYTLTLIVATNPLIRFFNSVASQIRGSEFRFCSTLDEAWDFLEAIDENLTTALVK